MSTTEDVLDHHLNAFESQDIEAVMADYDEDSVVVAQMETYRGLDEIRGLFSGLFEEFGQAGTEFVLDEKLVEGAHGHIIWHADTPDNEYEFATDTFHIPGEIIELQTFAGVITPKA